jgi:hypothetical protein
VLDGGSRAYYSVSLFKWELIIELARPCQSRQAASEMVGKFEFVITDKDTRIRREACQLMIPTIQAKQMVMLDCRPK